MIATSLTNRNRPEGVASTAERKAATAAIERMSKTMAAAKQVETVDEIQFSDLDRLHRKLLGAPCRRNGLKPDHSPHLC